MNTKFKQTEIGGIPKEWKVVRLGDELKLRNGERPTFSKKGQYPVYGANGIMGYSDESVTTKDYTIIIGRVGASGEIHLAKGKVFVSDNAIYSEEYNVQEIYLPFMSYLLKSKKLKSFATKTTHPIITQTFLKNFLISLPRNIKEQRKIAEILFTVDEAIQRVDEAIARTERLKRGLMQELLTKGIGHREFKFSKELGCKIPKEWEVVRLGEASSNFIGGGTPSTSDLEYWNGDIPWMTSAHINGRLITTGQRYITKKGLRGSAASLVPKKNVLVATRVGIGKVAINLVDIAISQDLTGVVIKKNRACPDFIYWALVKNQSKLKSLAQGSTIKGILREDLAKVLIPLPPLSEQRKIAEILSTVGKKFELERKRKEKLERIKRGLMNDLLTGRKRAGVVRNE